MGILYNVGEYAYRFELDRLSFTFLTRSEVLEVICIEVQFGQVLYVAGFIPTRSKRIRIISEGSVISNLYRELQSFAVEPCL